MAAATSDLIETRGRQMFPTLSPAQLDRLGRLGERKTYGKGNAIVRIGDAGHGLIVILAGQVDVTQTDELGHRTLIVTHGPGAFMGELAQLSGRPSLVDAVAVTGVDAVVIPPDGLRDVLVAEAELGEVIMRALILRRMGLIETAASGLVIIGPAGHAGCASAGRLPAPRRAAPTDDPGVRRRSRGSNASGAISRRSQRSADRALSERPVAAQSHGECPRVLPWTDTTAR